MGRFVLASILGGAAVFVWSTISWMVLPWHMSSIKNLPDGDATMAVLREKLPESGVYTFPPYPEDQTDEATMAKWEEKYVGGPYISTLLYHDSGYMDAMSMQFIRGYVLDVIAAGLLVYLLGVAGPYLRNYGQRAVYVANIGLFATIDGTMMDWNWWELPIEFSTPFVLDGIIAWSLAGLVIAALIRPQATIQ